MDRGWLPIGADDIEWSGVFIHVRPVFYAPDRGAWT
jgi:hypothetical protein